MPDRPPVSRRTALGLAGLGVAGLTVGACDVDDLRPPEDDATPSPTPTTPDQPTADEVLIDEVLTALGNAVLVLSVARPLVEARPAVQRLMRAHRAHIAALDGDVPTGGVLALPTDAAQALQMVRSSERTLRATLADAAGRAETGALARLLASASASVSQHLVGLA